MGCANTECENSQNLVEEKLKMNNSHNTNSSQLKETHSVLVKMLESAPLSNNINNVPSNPATRHQPHHHYRKRMKHLESKYNDDDKSSDEEMRSECSSDSLEKPSVSCPWKKSRIAKEFLKESSLTTTNTTTTTTTTNVKTTKKSPNNNNNKINNDGTTDDEDDDSVWQCSCDKNRRNSIESDDGISCHHDSGCENDTTDDENEDDDCPKNILELCKKFNRNLSEECDENVRRSRMIPRM